MISYIYIYIFDSYLCIYIYIFVHTHVYMYLYTRVTLWHLLDMLADLCHWFRSKRGSCESLGGQHLPDPQSDKSKPFIPWKVFNLLHSNIERIKAMVEATRLRCCSVFVSPWAERGNQCFSVWSDLWSPRGVWIFGVEFVAPTLKALVMAHHCHAAMHRIRFVWNDFKSDGTVEFLQSWAEVSDSYRMWCARRCKKCRCYQQCCRSQLMAEVSCHVLSWDSCGMCGWSTGPAWGCSDIVVVAPNSWRFTICESQR